MRTENNVNDVLSVVRQNTTNKKHIFQTLVGMDSCYIPTPPLRPAHLLTANTFTSFFPLMHTYTHARTHAHTHTPRAHACTPHAYLLTVYKGVRAFLSQNHQRVLCVDDVRIACVPVAHNILRWRKVTLLQRVTQHMQWTRHNDREKGFGTK